MRVAWVAILSLSCVESQRNIGSFCITGDPARVTVTLDSCLSSSYEVTERSCQVIDDGGGRMQIQSLLRYRVPTGSADDDCVAVTAVCRMPSLPEGTVVVTHGSETAVLGGDWSGKSSACSSNVDGMTMGF